MWKLNELFSTPKQAGAQSVASWIHKRLARENSDTILDSSTQAATVVRILIGKQHGKAVPLVRPWSSLKNTAPQTVSFK